MRRPEYAATSDAGRQWFHAAPTFHLAAVAPDGTPVLRTLHGVVTDGLLCFHSSPKGEKTSLLGCLAVASVETTVAGIPSYFFDPERACPATTLYRSAQAHGVIRAIDEPALKARVLAGLMTKLQPEGGYRPLSADDPMYRPAVRGLLVAGLPLDDVTAKAKLAQNRSQEERRHLLEQLWKRGAPGDVEAIEAVREANPGTPTPGFLTAPEGLTLHAALPTSALDDAVALLTDTYWNDRFSVDELRRAHLHATAWVGARDSNGALVATARALSDHSKYAWLYDVCVAPSLRRRGVGQAVLRLLLDHPAVRGARQVLLGTRDAQSLYARFDFVPRADLPPRPYTSTEMVLLRSAT